jgi:hypothetical protein
MEPSIPEKGNASSLRVTGLDNSRRRLLNTRNGNKKSRIPTSLPLSVACPFGS